LSDWVEQVLRAVLEGLPRAQPQAGNAADGLSLMPLVHVQDMARARDFYTKLGIQTGFASRDGDWAAPPACSSALGLLAHPPSARDERVELTFTTNQSLTELEERLAAAGVDTLRGAADEGFGYQLILRDPDGYPVKINQLDPQLYG